MKVHEQVPDLAPNGRKLGGSVPGSSQEPARALSIGSGVCSSPSRAASSPDPVDDLYTELEYYTRGQAELEDPRRRLLLELCDLLAEATVTW